MVHAQEVSVIDHKGTKTLIRNNTTNEGIIAPTNPVINDIWINTSDSDHQRVMIWNGSNWAEVTFKGIQGSIFFAGSDGIPTQNNVQFFWNNANYRLGIGTNSPSQSLDVNGAIRIRTLDNAVTTDEIIKADNNGVLRKSKVNQGGRWTNTDTSTNLNINNTVVPIFGSNDYVDDGIGLYEVSGNTLIVKESGRYDIRANIALLGIADGNILADYDHSTNVNARIAINGTPVGALAASGTITFINGNDHSSIHINEILQLNANDVITIISYREANIEAVRFSSSGTSNFTINKVH
tara:strand:- start:6815 stop:7699 length:885 start_codon:yes stop_codon:yes gene_type:complete